MNDAATFLIYVSLFAALYAEVFALLAYFGGTAKTRRELSPTQHYPNVAIVVPCFNEGTTVGGTVDSLLALEYPYEKLSLILVNDGSTDTTREVMEQYRNNSRIHIIHKENGGKHTGLNAGIAYAQNAEFIGCLDADSFVAPSALKEIMSHFDDPKVGAVTASLVVYKPKNAIEHMQYAEYLLGVTLRHIFSSLDALYVTPGPFTIFRHAMFNDIGTFKSAHNTEDMEIAMRMQKTGWKIGNAPRAQVFTKAPRTAFKLIKQRTRWTTGFIRNGYDYRGLFFNSQYGVLGLLVLPMAGVSILAALTLFFWSIYKMLQQIWKAISYVRAIPLHFHVPTLDWFYAPISTIGLLSLVAIAATVLFMTLGARIAKTEGNFGPSIVWYVLLYSIIAPLWLIRSVIDVLLGVRRSWR